MVVTPTSIPTPSQLTEDLSEIESWEIFQGTTYTIKYPSGWVLEGPHKGLTGFPEEIIIFSPGRYTALSVTLDQPPYGFSGPLWMNQRKFAVGNFKKGANFHGS